MAKKAVAAAVLAAIALFAFPGVANAAGYGDEGTQSQSGSATPGGTVVFEFEDYFAPDEPVSFAVTGEGPIGLSAVFAVETETLTKDADGDGSVELTVELPDDATGSYHVTATGLDSGTIGTATITIAAEDDGDDLAATGVNENAPLLIGGALGLLLLGGAVLYIVRRRAKA